MTDERLKALVLELIDEVAKDMKNRIDCAIGTGKLDCSMYDSHDYRPAKIILCALLLEERFQWKPLFWNDKEREDMEKVIDDIYSRM